MTESLKDVSNEQYSLWTEIGLGNSNPHPLKLPLILGVFLYADAELLYVSKRFC